VAILASIFIGPPGRGEDIELPPMVAENIASLKQHHPQLPHRLFGGEDIAEFLEAKFPREVVDAYNALKPFAYKADLARYCILYEMGGIYADLAYLFVKPLPFDGARPIVFRDLIWSATWDTSNSVIAAPPRHKAFECAIDLVCANVKRRYYGPTFLCPTGPTLFGKALATRCDAEDLIAGNTVVVERKHVQQLVPELDLPKRVRCLLLDLKPVALSRKRGEASGIESLGVAGGDDYRTRWEKRAVYEGAAVEDGS
jgi:mannosyltransferase OCH1-like enzyme